MHSSERENEITSVQSIYCDEYNTFEAISDTRFCFHSVPLVLHIDLPTSYPDPSHPPKISINSKGLGVSRLQMFQLRMRLESIIDKKQNELILFDLTEETREFTEGLRDDVKRCLNDEGEECLPGWQEDWQEEFPDFDTRIIDHDILRSHMGSKTIENIMSKLPTHVKLLHAEVVLRSDLRKRYLDMRRKIQEEASAGIMDRRARDAAWDKYGQEEIVFHGTLRQNVGSIVRHGFIVPGQKTPSGETIGLRCGTRWGQGIYTSPAPNFSLDYADYSSGGLETQKRRHLLPGQKLIVCAVLMGQRRHMTKTSVPEVEEGFHSHVSPSKLEYIVFNSAQILPLYVLHLGDGRFKDEASTIFNLLSGPAGYEGNLTQYARKYLPNGFGAASGHRFVVEAIAPVDDDEELWGEFQHDIPDEFQEEREARLWH